MQMKFNPIKLLLPTSVKFQVLGRRNEHRRDVIQPASVVFKTDPLGPEESPKTRIFVFE